MEDQDLSRDVERIEMGLAGQPPVAAVPYLIMLSGLPGAGKSSVARDLRRLLPVAIVESDAARWALFPRPTFSEEESSYVFQVVHRLMTRLLQRGVPVVMDATNLQERHREAVYRIAEACGAPLFILRVDAPQEVVRERIERRTSASKGEDGPLADWDVYLRMWASREPIARSHHAIDTSKPTGPALDRFVAAVEDAVAKRERTV